jgi:hypothetical protein
MEEESKKDQYSRSGGVFARFTAIDRTASDERCNRSKRPLVAVVLDWI